MEFWAFFDISDKPIKIQALSAHQNEAKGNQSRYCHWNVCQFERTSSCGYSKWATKPCEILKSIFKIFVIKSCQKIE